MKRHVLVLIVCINLYGLYSFSPNIESFGIENYSSNDLIVNYEFYYDHKGVDSNYSGAQEVNGVGLTIRDFIAIVDNNIVKPNRSLTIIQYYPQGSIFEKDYEGMYKIPFMNKINAIFKSLTIRSEDGKINIDLNNLENTYIKKMVLGGETAYILEIFDYDLEPKLASEW